VSSHIPGTYHASFHACANYPTANSWPDILDDISYIPLYTIFISDAIVGRCVGFSGWVIGYTVL